MKISITLWICFLFRPLLSQELPFSKFLLNNQDYIKKKVSSNFLDDPYFVKKIFCSSFGDSLEEYYSKKTESISAFEKSDALCYVLTYSNIDSFNITIKNIKDFINSGPFFFKDQDQSDYKKYLEFIERGLIIATVPSINKIIFLHVNSCIFEDNKKKTLSELQKCKAISDIFVFNCGGNPLANQIK